MLHINKTRKSQLARSYSPENHSPSYFSSNASRKQSFHPAENIAQTPGSDDLFSPRNRFVSVKEGRSVPHIIINLVDESGRPRIPSTGATETCDLPRSRKSLWHSKDDKLEKRAKSARGPVAKYTGIHSLDLKSLPDTEPVEVLVDEFSEMVAVSPFGFVDNDLESNESPRKGRSKSIIIIPAKTLTPYLSNVKTSPFVKGTPRSAFFKNENEKEECPSEILDVSNKCILELEDDANLEEKRFELNKIKNKLNRKNIFMDVKILERVCAYLEHGDVASLQQIFSSYKQEQSLSILFKSKMMDLFSKVQ